MALGLVEPLLKLNSKFKEVSLSLVLAATIL